MDRQFQADHLLYDGERGIYRTSGREVGFIVTTHRLLVVTPKLDGKNLHVFQRPNVTGLSMDTSGDDSRLTAGAKWVVVGIALVVAGAILDFDGLVGDVSTGSGTGEMDLSWVGGLFSLLTTALSLFDDVLMVVGLLAFIAGIGLVGWYWRTRSETITVSVAGQQPLEVPSAGFRSDDITELNEAIDPSVADDSNSSTR